MFYCYIGNIYLDIGYWVLIYDDQQVKNVIKIINNIDPNKKIKGFTLNLSNYRSNSEMINACKKIIDLSGHQYTCIIDTSRNANGPDEKNTWCNAKNAGIGNKPTKNTGNNIIDYFMWLKPAIEVDGHCYGSENSFQSSQPAGGNDIEYFKLLWNNSQSTIDNNQNNNNEFSDEYLIKNNPFDSMESQCKSDDNVCKDNVNKRRDAVNRGKNNNDYDKNKKNDKNSLRCSE